MEGQVQRDGRMTGTHCRFMPRGEGAWITFGINHPDGEVTLAHVLKELNKGS